MNRRETGLDGDGKRKKKRELELSSIVKMEEEMRSESCMREKMNGSGGKEKNGVESSGIDGGRKNPDEVCPSSSKKKRIKKFHDGDDGERKLSPRDMSASVTGPAKEKDVFSNFAKQSSGSFKRVKRDSSAHKDGHPDRTQPPTDLTI